jgi:hypothetical protein
MERERPIGVTILAVLAGIAALVAASILGSNQIQFWTIFIQKL